MDLIALRAPFGNHGHAIAERDQTFGSGLSIIRDGDMAAGIGMAMGKRETHRLACIPRNNGTRAFAWNVDPDHSGISGSTNIASCTSDCCQPR